MDDSIVPSGLALLALVAGTLVTLSPLALPLAILAKSTRDIARAIRRRRARPAPTY